MEAEQSISGKLRTHGELSKVPELLKELFILVAKRGDVLDMSPGTYQDVVAGCGSDGLEGHEAVVLSENHSWLFALHDPTEETAHHLAMLIVCDALVNPHQLVDGGVTPS